MTIRFIKDIRIQAPVLGFLIILMLSAGCRRPEQNETLTWIEHYGEENPKDANDSLLKIDSNGFLKSDRMHYDLLRVKLADKAFIPHESDSLILPVISYYSSHGSDDRYTEALYYCGRVYTDMGDYPSALKYYSDALNRTDNSRYGKGMRGKICAQMGGLLNSLRLYDEARRYINMAVELDRELRDSINLMYDLEVLGHNNINSRNYDDAEHNFQEAILIAGIKDPRTATLDSTYLAGIKQHKGQLDSAVSLIGDIPYRALTTLKLDDDSRQLVYFYAADIFRCATMPDSAYKYALELIKVKDARNLRVGYSILLSNELKDIEPHDSLRIHLDRYEALTEQYMNTNGDRSALIQNSFYNYSIVERERQKALGQKQAREKWLASAVIIILALAVGILCYRYRANRTIIKLHRALANSRRLSRELRQDLNEARTHEKESGSEGPDVGDTGKEPDVCVEENETPESDDGMSLRKLLINDLKILCNSRTEREPLSPVIAESQAYSSLREHIADRTSITDSDPLWEDLHKAILEASPDFDRHLLLLADGKVKPADYRIILLIKCGVTPTQLCTLVARTKGTMSYRRKMLGIRLTDDDGIHPGMIDNLIYSL